MKITVKPNLYKGIVLVPPSKSISQRAILISAFANGKSVLFNIGQSSDEKTMINAIKKLGAFVTEINNNTIEIQGIKAFNNLGEIEVEESALAFRLLLPCLTLFDGKNKIKAKGTLKNRPMDLYENILPNLGVKIKKLTNSNYYEIEGPINGDYILFDSSLSSQFLSGLLIALSLSKNNTLIDVKNLKSNAYVNLTIDVMNSFDLKVEQSKQNIFKVKGNQKARASKINIESDWSSASFFLVASALGQKINLKGLNFESKQADIEILNCFKKANCEIIYKESFLTINGNNRTNFDFDCTNCPDLIPILTVFAAFTIGKSKIKGASRLIHKESNRLKALIDEWKKLDVILTLNENDEICIEGKKSIKGDVEISSHKDHRIAMSFAIAAMITEYSIIINEAEYVKKSYPDFWNVLEEIKV